MIRKFSSLAIWLVLGVAVALAPLACSSDSTTPGVDSSVDHGSADSSTKS
jgi:hypothetical protein